VSVTIIQVNPMTIPIYKKSIGSIDATGTTEIRAQVDGFIEQQLFDAGQLVKANQLLYVFDQRIHHAELQKTKASVAKAEADLRFAKEKEGVEVLRAESRLGQSRAALVKADRDVSRYRSLAKQEAAAQQDLDVALAQQQVLREEGNLRKAEWEQTKLQQRTQIASAAAELERLITQKENEIRLLLAAPPGDIRRGLPLTAQPLPPEIPTGLPAALLDRRPNIRQAEEVLVAANAQIGAAKTLYFPTFSLTGVL
jgi:outer membrane protein, multidrug efflux system